MENPNEDNITHGLPTNDGVISDKKSPGDKNFRSTTSYQHKADYKVAENPI